VLIPTNTRPPPLRHAAGQHNAAVAATGDEAEYCNWAWLDSRLTEVGRGQAAAVRPRLEGTPLEVVFVSPLSRTIQTAQLAIPGSPPYVCDDRIRERNGTHPCDKRRSRTELAADFPAVDFSALTTEHDESWSEVREPWEALIARSEDFAASLLERPETHIAVVTHNDWLQALLLHSAVRIQDDSLRVMFGNAQHLSLLLTPAAGVAAIAAAASAPLPVGVAEGKVAPAAEGAAAGDVRHVVDGDDSEVTDAARAAAVAAAAAGSGRGLETVSVARVAV